MDQRPVTTFPLAEGSCNIMQSPDKLGAKVDHDSGVLTDMNCTLTTKTSGGLLQFLNILTYINNFNASENIFTNFLNYGFTKGDKSFLKELNDFRIKHAKIRLHITLMSMVFGINSLKLLIFSPTTMLIFFLK